MEDPVEPRVGLLVNGVLPAILHCLLYNISYQGLGSRCYRKPMKTLNACS